jgi:hypothetical protein
VEGESEATLNLSIPGLTRIPPLIRSSNVKSLILSGTRVSDLTPLRGQPRLKSLDITRTPIADLGPIEELSGLKSLVLSGTQVFSLKSISKLRQLRYLELRAVRITHLRDIQSFRLLETLDIQHTLVTDLSPLEGIIRLRALNVSATPVRDLHPISSLNALERLDISGTNVSDLSPLAHLTSLIDGANHYADDGGLAFLNCPVAKELKGFSKLKNPARTLRTINYLRERQGLSPYRAEHKQDAETPEPELPSALEGMPAPFDFEQTEHGTITVVGSDTNIPAFPFATSREDHARRLEACRVFATDLIKALVARQYDNVRSEFAIYLQRYLERLPQTMDGGNMLLADGMARGIAKLFAAEAEILPTGFAAELHTLLEQHIAACVYYPEIGAFNRDVRDGKPSRPFPLQAVQEFVKTVQAHTPQVFEPPVARALSDAQTTPPQLPVIPSDTPPPSPQTLTPPPIPGGDIDPRKSREFATAATANRLWSRVHIAASVTTVAGGVSMAAHELAPHASEIIQWLSEFLKSLPPL